MSFHSFSGLHCFNVYVNDRLSFLMFIDHFSRTVNASECVVLDLHMGNTISEAYGDYSSLLIHTL